MGKLEYIMNNLFKLVVSGMATVFSLVFAFKILMGSVAFNMTNFSFNDLLSMILALFSISLSLIFYHKATETSNTFYDNTYKFTSHVSEVLGRIEAGFTEKLRHIDEGYSKLGDRFDRLSVPQKKEVIEQIEKEEDVIEKVKVARDELFQELTGRLSSTVAEKESFLERLRSQDVELELARREINNLRKQLLLDGERRASSSMMSRQVRNYISERVLPLIGIDILAGRSQHAIRSKFASVADRLPKTFIQDMIENGFADHGGSLTAAGVRYLRDSANVAAPNPGEHET